MKLSKIIFIIIGCIILLTYFFLKIYTYKTTDNILEVATIKLKKFTNNFLANNINYDILNNANIDNILIINKNNDGEILYVDYNLDRAYEALKVVTDVIYAKMTNLENGDIGNIKDNDIKPAKKGLLLELPFFIGSSSPFIASLGPKVYASISFTSSILTNIKSQITSYGFNNALVELFVTIEIVEEITTPVLKKEIVIDYDCLVASKVINGRVPYFYGDALENKSINLDIPIT